MSSSWADEMQRELARVSPDMQRLLGDIIKKLIENEDVVRRSRRTGALNWDESDKGGFKVNLHPRL